MLSLPNAAAVWCAVLCVNLTLSNLTLVNPFHFRKHRQKKIPPQPRVVKQISVIFFGWGGESGVLKLEGNR